MRCGVVLLAMAVLADAGPAPAQVGPGPRPGFGGPVAARRPVRGPAGGVWWPAPVWRPVVVPVWGPWGVPPVWTQPVVADPYPVVVGPGYARRFAPGVTGGVGTAGSPGEEDPVDPDPLARARVEEAVRRGDLGVIRPQAGDARPAAFPPEPPGPPPPADPVRAAGFARPADPPAAPPMPPAGPAGADVARAREAFAAGQYGRAAELLAAAGADPAACFLLAQARTARGEYAAAVEAVREGLKRAPDWPASGFDPRAAYGPDPGRLDAHLADLRKAAAAAPADPTVGFLLGVHLWFLGDKPEAAKLLRKAAGQVRDAGVIDRFLAAAEGRNG